MNDYRDELGRMLEGVLAETHALTFKNVFGAVGAYVDGNIFAVCGRFGTALRLSPEALASLFQEQGVESLRYFPKGHIKKEYAVLSKRLLDDGPRFRGLVDESITFVTGRRIEP
jgi:TfoX/Sxy family transcriptional regulator of competence genes